MPRELWTRAGCRRRAKGADSRWIPRIGQRRYGAVHSARGGCDHNAV